MRNVFNPRKLRLESLEERTLLAVVAGGMAPAAFPAPTEASTWLVNTTDDPTSWDASDDILSLREAIDSAAEGDTILFDASLAGGTITLNGSELYIDKGITIDAASIGGITVDAGGRSRVFYVDGGNGANQVELISLTITGGNASNHEGGGIYNGDNGTLSITNSTISGNTSYLGGGIYNGDKGTLSITNSTISGNTAEGEGGGICNDGMLTITNSTISGNITDWGGGIFNVGTLTITNSTISGNTASYGGGINNDGKLTITNSTISGNTVSSAGGGIYRASGTVKLTNTIVSLNYAGHNNDLGGSYSGSNNIVGNDPGFVVAPVFDESGVLTNSDTLDLSLTAGSAAIDAGLNAAVETEFDVAGNPRIINGIVDIGAYEYVGSVTPLDAPVITSGSRGIYISYGANRHYLQWDAVAGASGYEVQYSTGGSSWTSVSTTGTGAVITDLAYGADVAYRVRALGTGLYTDSAWSSVKTFNVCPMDVNGDGDISGGDRSIVALMWLAEEGDEDYQNYADINGDGEISNADRPFIGSNWSKEAGDADLIYPRALRAADAAFVDYASAEPDVDSELF